MDSLALEGKAQTIGIDTETNGEDIRDGRGFAMGISIAWNGGDNGIYLPFRHRDKENNYDLSRWRDVLQRVLSRHRLVMHNAKFDLVSLATLGLKVDKVDYFCTMLLAHIVDENRPYSGYSLDSCAGYYLEGDHKKKDDDLKAWIKRYGWGTISTEMMAEYAAYDAVLALKLYQKLIPLLKGEKLIAYWREKQKTIEVVNAMEKNGIRIDVDLCKSMSSIGTYTMHDLVDALDGYIPSKPADLRYLLIEQLGLPYINKKRKNGTVTPTFDSGAMAVYEEVLSRTDNPTAQFILAYRGWQKAVSSNYDAYIRFLSPDGRLRCNYKLHGTHTGRMSCELPNLQQIPRHGSKPWNGEMKKCFIAKEGYTLIEADYSQLELRLGTAYARDQSLIGVFSEGRDIFTEMSEVLNMSRQDTKTFVYSTQYGGGNARISTVFNISLQEAAKIRGNYFKAYPGFQKASYRASELVKTNSKVQLWSGRYRHFLHAEAESYKSFNSLIQGGAADLMESTMWRLYSEGFNNGDCRLLLQVHDSMVLEVKNEILGETKKAVKDSMERVDARFGVRFAVEIKDWV